MWKLKIVFLLIIYFSGFATAIYCLAPQDRMDCKAAGIFQNSGLKESQNLTEFKNMCQKAYNKASASLSNLKEEDIKEAFNRGIQAIKEEIAKNSQNAQGKEDSND